MKTHSLQGQRREARQTQSLIHASLLLWITRQQSIGAKSALERIQQCAIGVSGLWNGDFIARGKAALNDGVPIQQAVHHFPIGVVH